MRAASAAAAAAGVLVLVVVAVAAVAVAAAAAAAAAAADAYVRLLLLPLARAIPRSMEDWATYWIPETMWFFRVLLLELRQDLSQIACCTSTLELSENKHTFSVIFVRVLLTFSNAPMMSSREMLTSVIWRT